MEKDKIYSLIFDYEKEKTNPLILLSNITKVLQGFNELNNALCENIDTDIEVYPCLVDIEKGSIKLNLKDIIEQKITDENIEKFADNPKKFVITSVLKFIRHSIFRILNITKELPNQKREQKIIETIEEEFNKIPKNDLLAKQINKNKILTSINTITQSAKNINKVILVDEINNSVIIDTTFEYTSPILETENNKKTNSLKVSLPIKKPDLLGASKWELIFVERKINATIEDTDFLEKVKKSEISFSSNMEMNCILRIEIYFSKEQKPLEERYFIEKVFKVVKTTEYKQSLLEI